MTKATTPQSIDNASNWPKTDENAVFLLEISKIFADIASNQQPLGVDLCDMSEFYQN
jgi:hypothetical protein